ncbi:hypothetical protein Tco_1241880, partial [Tanacetum coccineum]
MGCLPRSALFLVTESHSLTRSPETNGKQRLGECRDLGLPWV